MYQLGLKLWSTNQNYIEEAVRLYKARIYHYIELYIVPNSYSYFIDLWSNLDIPYVIHGAHLVHGLNLAIRERKNENMIISEEIIKFANKLKADIIIFHAGTGGDIKETVVQLNEINDNRIIIENKPYFALLKGLICNGHSPEEIQFIMEEAQVGFCLDISHCIYSANAKNINPIEYLKQFLKLNPKMFHCTDGDYNGNTDVHYHLGRGSFNFNEILRLLPEDLLVTIETEKSSPKDLKDFEKDVRFLNNIKDY